MMPTVLGLILWSEAKRLGGFLLLTTFCAVHFTSASGLPVPEE